MLWVFLCLVVPEVLLVLLKTWDKANKSTMRPEVRIRNKTRVLMPNNARDAKTKHTKAKIASNKPRLNVRHHFDSHELRVDIPWEHV